jgi:hypothetical protein
MGLGIRRALRVAKIHFIGGEKGGVGKSVVARLLAQYMIDHELPFLGFDTDRSHGALLRFYAGYASPVVIDRYEALDAIMEAAVEQPERRILVDLAAQTHEPLVRWMDESGVLDLAWETGIGVQYWHVMDTGRDSVDLLTRLLDRFGNSLQYVLVRNQLRGQDFSLLEASGQQERAIGLGAKVVTIKRLHETAINKIDASDSSFWSARQSDAQNTLGVMDRQRLKTWLRDANQQLDGAGI